MTAPCAGGEQPQQHPLAPGASPGRIRGALLPEDRGAFDAAYTRALDEARETLELTALFETLERWRRIAALQADRDNFRRVARRVAELRTGGPVPEDEPLPVTRAKAGL
ncbi:MAG: DUF6247 family protein [Pseudonocardiaceae bacterium]